MYRVISDWRSYLRNTLLNRGGEADRITEEAINRFPRGDYARQAFLGRARKENDPRRAAQIYQDYLDRFSNNISWCELAARGSVLLIAGHDDQFSDKVLPDAAAKWDSRERASVKSSAPSASLARRA